VAALANLRTLALAGTLLLAASNPASAREDRFTFRDFRTENADLSRREARQQYRAEFPRVKARDAEPINLPPVLHGAGSMESAITSQTGRFNDSRVRNELTRNRSAQVDANGQLARISSGLDLDLTSSQKNISLGRNLFGDNASITINVGGESKTVGAGSLVSAAEYVAVKQALNGGQTIVVERSGKASGGDVNLESIATERTALRASNLVVSEGVTTYGDFSRNSEFKLLGDLNNYGTVLAMNSDGSKRGGAIRADDINNFKGATIRSEVDLTLDAAGTLLNYGSIDSTGSLTLSAAGGVGNKGSISASGDLNLQTPTAINRGVMQSTNGNVNLAGRPDAVLAVDNIGGTIRANGAINVRDANYASPFDSHVWGGDLLSSELNMYTGGGTTNVAVEELTGVVNQYGYAAHVAAATENLKIGEMCLTGDPTVYNESGTMEITGDITVGEKLVLLSAGDITSSDNITIRASNASTGFKIEMIAGAAFTFTSGGGSGAGSFAALTVPPLSPTADVSLSGKKSKTGGAVLLGQNVTISTRPTDLSGNSNGEVVAVIAFGGKGATAGTIDLSGTTILTGGSGTGKNGSVYILAAGTKGDVIKTGIIDTTGGTNTGGGFNADQTGVVGIYTVDIVTSIKGQPVTYDSLGNRTSTAFLTGEKLSKSGNLIVTDTAAPIDINASGFIDINGGGSVLLNGQVVADDAATNAGSLELISNGSIVNGPNGTAVSSSVIFMIAPTIGAADNPIKVDAPDVSSFSGKGGINYVEVMGTGDLNISGTSAGILSFYAPGRTNVTAEYIGFNITTIATDSLVLTAQSLGLLENIEAGDIDIRVSNGDITNANFNGPFQARTVALTTAGGSIGTEASPFTLGRGLQTISATSETGNIYLAGTEGKLTFGALTTGGTGSIAVTNTDSVTLANTVNAGGTFSMTITQGTITVPGVLNADEGIILMNTSTNGKIAVDKDATISTDSVTPGNGNVTLSVGPDTATPAAPPANVAIDNDGTGTVTITGSGIKAKTPINTLHTEGDADILINNGNKSGNITFGGNVNINAVQTVP